MRRETEKILQYTPYNSYGDLFGAVFGNKASIRLSNNACRQITQTKKPVLANFGIHFGFIPSAITTIAFAVCSKKYLLLLLLLAECVFPFVIYLLNGLRIKTWFIAGVVVVCDLFFFEMPVSILILALSWLFNSWTISWWQKRVYIESVKILQYNEEAFEWAYNSHNLIIEDCFGNTYCKLRQNELEEEAYERLLKVVNIGAGTESVDEAITKFSAFYLKKGVEIPNELYWGVAHLSKIEKCECLLKILELGTGEEGLDKVVSKLADFYKAKGIHFSDDI